MFIVDLLLYRNYINMVYIKVALQKKINFTRSFLEEVIRTSISTYGVFLNP